MSLPSQPTDIAPRSEAVIDGFVERVEKPLQHCIFEPKRDIFEKTGINFGRHLVQQGHGIIPISVVNPTNVTIKIHGNWFFGGIEARSISFLKNNETELATFDQPLVRFGEELVPPYETEVLPGLKVEKIAQAALQEEQKTELQNFLA